jgi:hypothetical protein
VFGRGFKNLRFLTFLDAKKPFLDDLWVPQRGITDASKFFQKIKKNLARARFFFIFWKNFARNKKKYFFIKKRQKKEVPKRGP